MIYLKRHEMIIREQLEHYAKTKIKNEQVEESFLMGDYPSIIFEEIANQIESVFAMNLLKFLLEDGKKHDLTFEQLKDIIT